MLRISLILALYLLSPATLADRAAEVRCQEIAFSKAAEARDGAAFAALLHDDARFVGNSVLRGPAEIMAAWEVFFAEDGPLIKWRPQFVEVLEDDDLALTRGPYRIVTSDQDGNEVERWGTFNSVWQRTVDGNWRVVFDAGSASDDPPDDAVRTLLDAEDEC